MNVGLCDIILHCEVSPMVIWYAVSDFMPKEQVFCKLLYHGSGLLFESRNGKCILRKMCLCLSEDGLLSPNWIGPVIVKLSSNHSLSPVSTIAIL